MEVNVAVGQRLCNSPIIGEGRIVMLQSCVLEAAGFLEAVDGVLLFAENLSYHMHD
jgi:hypothetical protein